MPELNEVIRDILKTNGVHAYTDHTDWVPNLSDTKVTIGEVDPTNTEIHIYLPRVTVEATAFEHLLIVIRILKGSASRFGGEGWIAETRGSTTVDGNSSIGYSITYYCKTPE